MIDFQGRTEPRGDLQLRLIKSGTPIIQPPNRDITLGEILKFGSPWAPGLSPSMRRWKRENWPKLFRGVPTVLAARALRIPTLHGSLFLARIDGRTGQRVDYGLAGLRLVTTVGVNYLAADMNDGASDISAFDFCGIGTGGTTDAATDTALGTELTTQYATDNVRPTGTASNPSANQYRSLGTVTPDTGGTLAIIEHGLFSSATVGAGTLWDRTSFAAVNLITANGDSIQCTYTCTFASGG